MEKLHEHLLQLETLHLSNPTDRDIVERLLDQFQELLIATRARLDWPVFDQTTALQDHFQDLISFANSNGCTEFDVMRALPKTLPAEFYDSYNEKMISCPDISLSNMKKHLVAKFVTFNEQTYLAELLNQKSSRMLERVIQQSEQVLIDQQEESSVQKNKNVLGMKRRLASKFRKIFGRSKNSHQSSRAVGMQQVFAVGALPGSKRSHQPTRNKRYDTPEILFTALWNSVSIVDINSVERKEDITNTALFYLLHHLVKTHNDVSARNVVSLTHFSYFDAVGDYTSGAVAHIDPTIYHCFRNEENQRILIPVLESHHFVLIEGRLHANGPNEINVYDPLFNNNRDFLPPRRVQKILTLLNFGSFVGVEPHYATRNEIFTQSDNINCGIYLLQNVQALLNNPPVNGADLMQSYPSEVTDHTIHEQRQNFAKVLTALRDSSNSNSKKPKFSADVIGTNSGNDDEEIVVDSPTSNSLSTRTLDVGDQTKTDWITIEASESLPKNLNSGSWNEIKCICSMKIRTQFEKVERDSKYLVTTECSSNICKIAMLVANKISDIAACGAQNLADLIIVRMTGKCDIDWKSDITEPGWENIGVCTDHAYEVGHSFFSTSSKTFLHAYVARNTGSKSICCSWPKNAVEPHSKSRPKLQTHITKAETNLFLKKTGVFLPPGLPLCNVHKNFVTTAISTQFGPNTPKFPSKKLPPSTSWSKKRGSLQNFKKTTPSSTNIYADVPDRTPRRRSDLIRKVQRSRIYGNPGAFQDSHTNKAIANIEKLVNDDYELILARLYDILTADIRRLRTETDDQYALRILGRISFHVSGKQQRTDEDVNICDVFPLLYKKFMGLVDEEVVEDEKNDDEEDDAQENDGEGDAEENDGEEGAEENDGEHDKDDENEPNDQYVPGEDPVVQASAPIPRMRKDVEKELDDNIADVVGPELRAAEQDTRDVAKKITFVRLCTDLCQKPKKGEASFIHSKLLQFVNAKGASEQEELMVEFTSTKHDEIGVTVYEWIEKFQACFQGLRSIHKRLVALDRLDTIRGHIRSAKNGSQADVDRVIEMDFMPDHLKLEFNRLYADMKCYKHHTQPEVERKFGKLGDAFNAKMKDVEDKICDVCTQYTVGSEIYKKPAAQVDRYLLESKRGGTQYDVCRMCWREMLMNKMPQGALKNGMGNDAEPKELKCLNNIEHMLIQRVRAIQKIFHLRDIGGRKTAMKATSGVLTMVKVAIEETVEHVADVLPSAAKMIIHVSTPWNKFYLVSMKRIVAALTWLKKNNKHYTNIVINERFSFELGVNVIFEREDVTDDDVEELILRKKENDDHLLTQADFDEQAYREVIPVANDSSLALEKFMLKKDKFRPLSCDEPHIDERVFPSLHPYGRFGMSHKRKRFTTMTKMIRHRLLQKNRCFATNASWYAFMYGLRSQKTLTSILGIQARLNRGAVQADVRLNDPAFNTTMSRITANLRGSPAYWQTVRYELRAHIASFGNPTFFLTLNSNETKWTDLHDLYAAVTGRTVDGSNIREEIAKDPTIYSRYWKRRIAAFFREIILVPDGPLGTITHYFYRVEYQHRGTQHVHCLLWSEERPPKDATCSEVTNFIDKYVTARLPSEKDEPELFDIIENNQKHWNKHSKTCLRITRYRGKMMKRCRFDFPRPQLRRTTYYQEKTSVLLPGLDKREYYLARNEEDIMVNDYNPTLSLYWKGNIDLQVIMASSVAVCNYITAYTTKGEKAKKMDANVGIKVSKSGPMAQETFKDLFNMMSNRECGGLEIVDDLLGHKNFAFDRAHTFIHTDASDRRARMLKAADEIAKLAKNDKCYVDNMLDVYYPKRHDKLKNFSLFNIMINYDVVAENRGKKSAADDNDDVDDDDDNDRNDDDDAQSCNDTDYHYQDKHSPFYSHGNLKDGMTYKFPSNAAKLFRKRKQTVPRFFLPELDDNDEEIEEDFYRRLCIMFIPWEQEDTLLEDHGEKNYQNLFWKYRLELADKSRNASEDLDRIVSSYVDLKKQDALISERLDAVKKAMKDLDLDHDMNEEIEVQKRLVDEVQHDAAKTSMNIGQKQLFEKIIGTIAEQEKKLVPKKSLRMFISGTAGTGKSFLINALADELTLKYTDQQNQGFRPAVLIAAPTGLAAIGVKGATIHSLFGIEVQHGKDSPFSAMRDEKRDLKRALFSNVKLVIIDEISMCSNITLMKMHCRLQEIMGSTDLFGGLNIVAFGDLLQLPPVLAPCVFEEILGHQMRQIFASISININLWSQFEYAELVENMRQRKDLEFAELMGRTRLQALTSEDLDVLRSRIIPINNGKDIATFAEMAEHFVQLQQTDAGALALFATNVEVAEFNEKVMKLRKMDTTRIWATETAVASARENTRRKSKGFGKIWQRLHFSLTGKQKKPNDSMRNLVADNSPNMAGGLPLVLDVAVGARVMLRRNLDTPNGLVNGATGELVSIEFDVNNFVTALFIKFDKDTSKVTRVERVSVYYDVSFEERRSRNQFPIVMAFGATVHKAQGLTLKNVLVCTRHMFCAGQFFVAASRVQNIDGLHLCDLDEGRITVHIKSLVEYNRLRKSIGMDEHLFPVAKPSSRKNTRPSDGTVVVMVDQPNKKRQRKVRVFDDPTEASADEMIQAIPEFFAMDEHEVYEIQSVKAVVLIILIMTDVRRGILNLADDEHMTPDQLEIQDLLRGGRKCIDHLIRRVQGFNSPSEVFAEIFSYLPDELKPLLDIKLHREEKCTACHVLDTGSEIIAISEIESTSGTIETILNSVNNRSLLNKVCVACGEENCIHQKFTVEIDDKKNKYFVLSITSVKNHFKPLDQDSSKFFERRWTPIAYVMNLGRPTQVCYLALNKGSWLMVEGNSKPKQSKKPAMDNVNIIVFKRKLYERERKKGNDSNVIKAVDDLYPPVEEESFDENEAEDEVLEERDPRNPHGLLTITNANGDDCFLISAVNMIHSMRKLREEIFSAEVLNRMLHRLRPLLDGSCTKAIRLRKELPEFMGSGQQDAIEALRFLLTALPENMKRSFITTQVIQTVCSRGCPTRRNESEQCFMYWKVPRNVGEKTSISSIEQRRTKTVRCQCGSTAEQTKFFVHGEQATNMLVSRIVSFENRFSYNLPDIDSVISLFGKNWKIKAIIEYKSTKASFGRVGHWVTWYNASGSWTEIDDGTLRPNKTPTSVNETFFCLYNLEPL